MSRDDILAAVKENQPPFKSLPEDISIPGETVDLKEKFAALVVQIGGKAFDVSSFDEINEIIKKQFSQTSRVISLLPELDGFMNPEALRSVDPHDFQDVDLALIKAHFGVAENGAVWVTDNILPQRILPFITQHLVVVLDKTAIVSDMHQAYQRIGAEEYEFATFIAGPSKTADIEQSLVLGAHGPRSLTVFLL